ncbi:MAG: hypothetical protein COA42_12605 [Alteromonadaceae bacterium]|nr:MAG: hypothetical protein COA42_12605 [Alteromonadaceae bacterium]
MKFLLALALATATSFAVADCELGKSPKSMSTAEIGEHYKNCVRDDLIVGYQAKKDPLALEYTSWKAVATGPAKPGMHGGRYLMTYVNDTGFAEYVKYNSTDANMPIGTKIAKESYKLKKKGKVKAGPVFFMEKVGKEMMPKTDGWKYSAVKPSGKVMKVKQGFCHGCHKIYPTQDFLGYPVSDVRL